MQNVTHSVKSLKLSIFLANSVSIVIEIIQEDLKTFHRL